MTRKISTFHPQGKSGINIDEEKYRRMKQAILSSLTGEKELTHSELAKAVKSRLRGRFEGSVDWYMETVKLDLEARKIIQRRADVIPHRYHRS